MPGTTPPARGPVSAIALMYHALARDAQPEGQDPHYTLPLARFGRQLDLIKQRAGGAGSARDWLQGGDAQPVLLTFDDGHISNHRLAFPALRERGMRADFFVNPALVGQRNFAGWPELREMADAGMSIQSHGYDHVYLTALSEPELRRSLRAARREIEDRIGAPVSLLAPPGGRMPRNLTTVARECGYERVLTSQPGRIRRRDGVAPLPRMAVTAGLDEATLRAWIGGGSRGVLRERVRYGMLAWAKRALGDERYEQVRARALNARKGHA